MPKFGLASLCLLGACLFPSVASATKSSELYTSSPYGYGRFEARVRFTAGDGVVSAFFLWKEGSEVAGTFWNELDYEKIDADCKLQTNALYGNPSVNHNQRANVSVDLCSGFHVYAYEWTADYIAWFFDGTEVRRETGETAAAFAQNASAGMQIHFNIWPGDSSFGGNLDPSILPVHQYVDWAQFSSYADGAFTLAWREDFDAATAPTGWLTGDWDSPKGLSKHLPANVNFLSSCAVLSLTADETTGPTGADPTGCTPGMGSAGAGGMPGQGGMGGAAAGASPGGAPAAGGAEPGGAGGASATGGNSGTSGTSGSSGTSGNGGATGAGAGNPTGGSGAVATGAAAGASSAGMPGAPGAGGSATGGASASVGGSSMGGNPTDGGNESTAGDGAKDDDASGCGCRVPRSTHSSERGVVGGAALVLALAAALRRRRAPRVSRRN
jgi:MYXO-CTERM domain-containing protein